MDAALTLYTHAALPVLHSRSVLLSTKGVKTVPSRLNLTLDPKHRVQLVCIFPRGLHHERTYLHVASFELPGEQNSHAVLQTPQSGFSSG
jgi:hypothetical protein